MENQASQSQFIGSKRAQVQAIDLNFHHQDQEVQKRDVQEVHPSRTFTRGPWSNDELLVLCTAYQEWFETNGPTSSNWHLLHQTPIRKWESISKRCFQLGINKSPNQCNNKWHETRADFQKVYDYEKNVPSGRPSFWSYSESDAKKLFKLRTIMTREVYFHIISWLPRASCDIQLDHVMDTTTINNPSGSKQGGRDAFERGYDSKDNAIEIESQSNTTKRRKTLTCPLEALPDALVLNREKLVEVIDRTQDREDARYRELVEMEREKTEANRETSQALVGALQSMANAMALMAQTLAKVSSRQ